MEQSLVINSSRNGQTPPQAQASGHLLHRALLGSLLHRRLVNHLSRPCSVVQTLVSQHSAKLGSEVLEGKLPRRVHLDRQRAEGLLGRPAHSESRRLVALHLGSRPWDNPHSRHLASGNPHNPLQHLANLHNRLLRSASLRSHHQHLVSRHLGRLALEPVPRKIHSHRHRQVQASVKAAHHSDNRLNPVRRLANLPSLLQHSGNQASPHRPLVSHLNLLLRSVSRQHLDNLGSVNHLSLHRRSDRLPSRPRRRLVKLQQPRPHLGSLRLEAAPPQHSANRVRLLTHSEPDQQNNSPMTKPWKQQRQLHLDQLHGRIVSKHPLSLSPPSLYSRLLLNPS